LHVESSAADALLDVSLEEFLAEVHVGRCVAGSQKP
jgi:hypothetical protein